MRSTKFSLVCEKEVSIIEVHMDVRTVCLSMQVVFSLDIDFGCNFSFALLPLVRQKHTCYTIKTTYRTL